MTAASALIALAVVAASPGEADTAPPVRAVPATVSADALPSPQIDGVVWSQAVVGNTVYAGGNFATARPAGAAPKTKTVSRPFLLAFDVRSGKLSSWAPQLNGQVTAIAVSPDRTRVYVGGSFTKVNGVRRSRIAAFDTAHGALVPGFVPVLDAPVRALAVSAGTVYAGGAFSTANGIARGRLVALAARTGGVTRWAPAADSTVTAMVLTPDGSGVVVGGHFAALAGRPAPGLGAVDSLRGRARAFAANAVVKDAGVDAAITSLTTDGRLVYGTGYSFNRGGNFEGTFAADPTTGAIVWLEDCHGDTYSVAVAGPVVYTVGHAHFCGNVGGFPETDPRTTHRALAFTAAATGKVSTNTEGKYADFGGQPAPRLLTWWPNVSLGTFTGQNQGAWSVVTTGPYVVLGGEFTTVNDKPQQGLVRFVTRPYAPNKKGPYDSGADLGLAASPGAAGQAHLTWHKTWDRDNELLTYSIYRDGGSSPVSMQNARTTFWTPGEMTFTDTNVTPGEHSYRLTVKDPFGNTVASPPVTVTVGG